MPKIALIREGKTPPDKRVALSPKQCAEFKSTFPDAKLVVESSEIRAFSDEDYKQQGIEIVNDVSDCDILIGVKEVPIKELIPNKTYLFFSHTYKKQPYNKALLQSILEKNIRLIDYEVMTKPNGSRVIGFGRYAGIVGCYNGFLAWGKKYNSYELKPAHKCFDRAEMEQQFSKINLPSNFKTFITGNGRVAGGAQEVFDKIGITKVSVDDYLTQEFHEPVYCQAKVQDYNKLPSGEAFENSTFYNEPEKFESDFMKFAKVSDMYISCHFWDHRAPKIFTREDAKKDDFKIKLVADISCDIDSAIASTLRPSTIADPLYGYNPNGESEGDFMHPDNIGVMAVDNLPCELPRDASEDFGKEMLNHVLPALLNQDNEGIIERATETNLEGKLTKEFKYLESWLAE